MGTNNIFQYIDDKTVAAFIKKNDEIFNKKLTRHFNYSRVACLADFQKITPRFDIGQLPKVAVVSGSPGDPELKILSYENLDILDYDACSDSYNLDRDWSTADNFMTKGGAHRCYDFVLCNQVFEHIYSPFQGLKNVSFITRPGGYIWISIPTINCIHGEPYFYSAGYHPRFLHRLGKEAGLECVHIGAWGNKKYLTAAVLGRWLTHDQLRPGFHSKFDFAYPYHALKDGRVNDLSGNFITDCWALFKKTNI